MHAQPPTRRRRPVFWCKAVMTVVTVYSVDSGCPILAQPRCGSHVIGVQHELKNKRVGVCRMKSTYANVQRETGRVDTYR